MLSCVNGAIHALEGALMFTEVNVVGQVVGASGISGAPSAHCIWRLAAGDKWQHMAGMSTGSTQCDSPAGSSGRFVWQHPVDARFVGAEMSGWPRLELEANAAPPTMARLLLRTIAAVREHSCCTVAIAQVRWVDAHGRSDLAGYALLCAARPASAHTRLASDAPPSNAGGRARRHVPTCPGCHSLECQLWRPRGSLMERVAAWFVGGYPQLKDKSLVFGRPPAGEADVESAGAPSQLARAVGKNRLETVNAGKVELVLHICLRTLPEMPPKPATSVSASSDD